MTRQNLAIFIVVFIIMSFGLGFFIGRSQGISQVLNEQASKVQALQSQIEKAKTYFPQTSADIRNITGKIKTVDKASITIETNVANPFDTLPPLRTVSITDKTKILQLGEKDQATVQKEVAAYRDAIQKGVKSGALPSEPPTPFEEKTATIGDLKPAMVVSITANENIHDKQSFEAASIRVSP